MSWSSLSSLSGLSDFDDDIEKLDSVPRIRPKKLSDQNSLPITTAKTIPKRSRTSKAASDNPEINAGKKRRRSVADRENPFEIYNDEEFWQKFRFRKETVAYISTFIKSVEPFTKRSKALSAVEQLLVALSFYTSGTYQRLIGDVFKIEQPTVHRIVHRVSNELAKLLPQFIYMPDEKERAQVTSDFYTIAGFPTVLGVIDCLQINIHHPGGKQPDVYRNQEGKFALNCQVVCDAKLKIRHLSLDWPGSMHKDTIFMQSPLSAECETGAYTNHYLLGDGYYCRPYLMTPVLNCYTEAEVNYNRAHNSTKNTIDRMFACLKTRFPCLKAALKLKIKNMPAVIASCAVLYNIAIEQNDNLPPGELGNVLELMNSSCRPVQVISGEYDNVIVRSALINTCF